MTVSKKLPLKDFRARRSRLEPHEFPTGEGQAPAPDVVDPSVWGAIMHVPEDLSVRISDHNGHRLELLHALSSDWLKMAGDSGTPDEIQACLIDAAGCLQGATFNFLHGYYRGALAELRTAFELTMIGTYGSLLPGDEEYRAWKSGTDELRFARCRRRLGKALRTQKAGWLFENDGLLATRYRELARHAHPRPNGPDDSARRGNGPLYDTEAIRTTFLAALTVMAMSYLLVRVARPGFEVPEASEILFGLDEMPDHALLVRGYTELYGRPPKPPVKAAPPLDG